MSPSPRLRAAMVGLLTLATTINYIDRQALSVAAPVISRELGLSATDYSRIVFFFLLAYALMQVVTGAMVDRLGARLGFAAAIVGWSLASMAHALGRGVMSFSVLRFILGFFEAANFPAALKAIAEWFPPSERSSAVGWVNVGPGLGAILAPPLVAWLTLTWGWRAAFVGTGVLGFVWVGLWLGLYRQVARSMTPKDPGSEPGPAAPAEPRMAWPELVRDRRGLGLMIARFTSDGAFYFFVFWLPTYLAGVRGFEIREIGLFAWMPFLASDLGALTGGFGSTYLIRRGWSIDASRKIVMWTGAVLSACALPAAAASTPYLALAWISVALFGIQVKCSSVFTLPADLFPAGSVALAWGLSGAAGSLGGMLFQLYVGRMVDTVGYNPVFLAVSVMHLLSAGCVMLFIPRIGARERA